MQLLAAGQNTQLPTSPMTISIRWANGADMDVAAVLVTAAGKVRSDDDFVFYNQPTHSSSAVRLLPPEPDTATLSVDLTRVEPTIDRIVVTASVHEGAFDQVNQLVLDVIAGGQAVVRFPVPRDPEVAAVALAELYRRGGGWKVRAVGQGWSSGLAGLASDYGISVEDDSANAPSLFPPAPPAAPSPHPPAPPSPQPHQPHSENCRRCGHPLKPRRFRGGFGPCKFCERQVSTYLQQWKQRAAQILAAEGPDGPAWEQLWSDLQSAQISAETGREAMRPLAAQYLERCVSFAFADGIIEKSELADFERYAATLQLNDSNVAELRARMIRGRTHSKIREGELPRLTSSTVHLDAGELLHLDTPATQVRFLASGPKYAPGRLVATNKKLRFIAATTGFELTWAKAISVTQEYGTVTVGATTARGGGTYQVPEADYVAAVLEGTMRVAKRLVLDPGRRDSRSIPPHIKIEVWNRDGGKCTECGDSHYLEYDHVIPLSQGGATSVNNLQILCRACNLAKGSRI